MPTFRLPVGTFETSEQPDPTETVVVVAEAGVQASKLVAPPGAAAAGVVKPMGVHAHTLIMLMSPTPPQL